MIEYVFKVFCSLIVLLITFLLAPVLALWPRQYWPWFACWLGQWDDDMDGTLDPGWRTEHILRPDTGWRKWLNRTRWIWRNPAQYFEYYVLGIPLMDGCTYRLHGENDMGDSIFSCTFDSEGNGTGHDITTDISDIPVFRPGWLRKIIINYDGRKIWGFRWVFKWPWINRCCNMQFGYKIWGSKVCPGTMAKLVFSPISFSKMGTRP